jgi:8-oxo-dGTP pyrophosphatase MutT (NUDIX family)
MEKIKTTIISIGINTIEVELYNIEEKDNIEDISRVYVVAIDEEGKVPLIYNSKRDIWGFPGGHIEKGESIIAAANRECIEEIKKSIKNCEQKFLMINQLDENKNEKQVICFAKIGQDSVEFIDENESIKKIVYLQIDEIIQKIGNENLWRPIITEFNNWV